MYLISGCFDREDDFPVNNTIEPEDPEWLVPRHLVFDGGPGKDGIRSIDKPVFGTVQSMEHLLSEDDLIIGFKVEQTARAYPHKILDWHEIVNDYIEPEYFSINYCPLTGTGMAWNRKLKLGVTTFGVSGLIYKTNLIPYDRETDSEWSQMMMKSIHGWNKRTDATLFPVFETKWSTWKTMYPESEVMNDDTGSDLPYDIYPYGDYKEQEHRLFFGGLSPIDLRLPLKERVFGIRINEKVKVYRFLNFQGGTQVVHDVFQDVDLVIVGNEPLNFIVGFESSNQDGNKLSLVMTEKGLPAILEDEEGNVWDIFGVATEGPRTGHHLRYHPSLVGYWFTFGTFYPRPEIFEF